MAAKPDQGRILVVGNEASARRVGLQANGEGEVELVDSLEEAAARHATGNYARIVVDPAALKGVSFEVLAPVPERRGSNAELVSLSTHASRTAPEPTPQLDGPTAPPQESEGSGPASTVGGALSRAEEELARQRELLQAIIDNIPVLLTIWDGRLREFRFNEHQRRVLGWTEQDATDGDFMSKVYPDPDYRRDVEEYMLRRELGWRDLRTTAKDGRAIDISWANVHLSGDTSVGIGVDITERKQAEKALRESNERLALISNAISRLLESDRPQEVVSDLCSRVMEHLDCQVFFNYLVIEEKDCLHLNACSGVSEETAKSIEWLDYGEAVCGCVAQDGCGIVAGDIPETQDPRTELVASFGVKAYACYPLLAENGRLLGTLSFGTKSRTEFSEDDLALMRTIADHAAIAMSRLEIQEDLRRSEERFRAIFETAPTGIVTMDLATKHILTSNRAFHEMLGYTSEEITRKTITDITHPDDIEYDLDLVKEVVEGRSDHFHLEKRYFRKDGGIIWGHLTGAVVRGPTGAPLYGIGLVQDITKRRLAEEAQRRYELLADNSRDIILFVRRGDGRILEANSAAVEVYGYTRDELLDLTIADLRPPEARDPLPDQIAEADTHGVLFETTHKRKNGEVFPVEVGSRGANIGDARVLISVVRDITDRKRLEGYREELLKRERKIAETLQEAIVPAQIVSQQGDYAFYVVYEPAYKEAEIGGDFYDVFDLGEGKVGVLIGDVAGKGLAAAVRVAAVRYAVRGYAYIDPRPGRVLAWANDVLCRESADQSRTLTAFFAVVDTRLHTMTYASAGHEPPIAMDREGRCANLTSTGTLLGMLPETLYGEESLRIDDIERIVMVTDGITEARPPGGALFTEGGLTDYLLCNRTAAGPVIAVGLVAAAMEHAGGPLRDDAAVVVIERADRHA